LMLILKWLVVIVLFFLVAMPAQIIWFFIYPFAKTSAKKQQEKTGVYVPLNVWSPMEYFGTTARKFIESTLF